MQEAGKWLLDLPNFSRGLPTTSDLQKPNVATVFRKLLTQGSVVTSSGDSDVEFCCRRGWVHSERHSDEIHYAFPSPLHAIYISWKLIPAVVSCPFATIQYMAFSILKQFIPSQLSSLSCLGVAFCSLPLEPHYQFEFYCNLFAATNGAVCISPELVTMTETSKGCINFFIPQKKWKIKLIQDGSESKIALALDSDVSMGYGLPQMTWWTTSSLTVAQIHQS